jgi:cystathionine beta-lyase/cystathionine gamma-synthase
MSKIDDYNNQKRITRNVKDNLYQATGYFHDGNSKNSNNDKHSIYFRYTGKHTDMWSDAIFHLHASYGFYGSSSGYSAMNKEVAEYINKAIDKYITQIVKTAIEYAEEDQEKARKEAEDEAKQILNLIGI